MKNHKEFLDKTVAAIKAENPIPPDCWIVYKTLAPFDQIAGAPLAIYGKLESLYECFEDLCNETDSRFGITLGAWWFDDPKPDSPTENRLAG